MNDNDILSMKKVTPQIAARYLGVSDDTIRDGLRNGAFMFGSAFKSQKSGKWIYDIRPDSLVKYNRNGRVSPNLESLADMVAEKIIEKMEGR